MVDSNTNRRPPGWVINSFAPQVIAALLAMSLIMTTPVSGVQASPSAEEALEKKETAEGLLKSLQTMAQRPGIDVDAGVVESVAHNIERGNLEFTNEDYAAAIEHYDRAIEQARSGLTPAYKQAAALELDVAESRLTAVTERGYESDRTARLESQLAAEQKDLSNIESFAEARSVYHDAQALDERTSQLPTPTVVAMANHLVNLKQAWPVVVVAVITFTSLGIWLWRSLQSRRNDENSIPTH